MRNCSVDLDAGGAIVRPIQQEDTMFFLYALTGVLAVLLCIYLFVSLIKPELFP